MRAGFEIEEGSDLDVVVVVSGLLGLVVGALAPAVAAWACAARGRAGMGSPPLTVPVGRSSPGRELYRPGARFAVAVGTAGVFAGLAARLGPGAELFVFLYLAAVGVPLAIADFGLRRLPDRLTLPSYVVAAVLLTLATATGPATLTDLARAGLGAAAAVLGFGLLALAQPRGLGLGDVKLAGLLGLHTGWLGWTAWYVGFLVGVLVAGLGALTLVLAGCPRTSTIPFGPFLLLGTLVAVLVGNAAAVAAGVPR